MIKTKQQTVDLLLLICTIIVGVISYILNIGWIRVIFFLPFLAYNIVILIIGIMYALTNYKKATIIQKSVFYINLLTYILFNVFLCDGGDIGPAYCFFGLLKVYENDSLFYNISMGSLLINLISSILIVTIIIKRKNEYS